MKELFFIRIKFFLLVLLLYGIGQYLHAQETEGEYEITLTRDINSQTINLKDTFSIDFSFVNDGQSASDILLNTGIVDLSDLSIKKVLCKDTVCANVAVDSCVSDFTMPCLIADSLERNQYIMVLYKFTPDEDWRLLRSSLYKNIIGLEGPLKEEEAKISYLVKVNFRNLSSVIPDCINKGDTLKLIFQPDEGYSLPDSVEVTVDEKEISSSDFSYDALSGKFQLNDVQGNVEIRAEGKIKEYEVDVKLENLKASELPETVLHGNSLTFKISPDAGYKLPETILVVMGKDTLQVPDYKYDPQKGEFVLDKVTDTIYIVAKGLRIEFAISAILKNVRFTNALEKIAYGDTLRGTFQPDEGYSLPSSISVEMGKKDLPSSRYSYDSVTGKFELGNVTGAVKIQATALKKIFPVRLETENLSVESCPDSIAFGDTLRITMKTFIGYGFPSSINVKMTGVELSSEKYAYDTTGGLLVIPDVKGKIEVKVKGVLLKQEYTIIPKLKNLNLSVESKSYIGQSFAAVLSSKEGYRLPTAIEIHMNGKLLPASAYKFDKDSGKILIITVTGDIEIIAEGVKVYNVKSDFDNLVVDDFPTTIDAYTTLTGKFRPVDGFKLPRKITVIIGKEELSPFFYSYSPSTGAFEVGNVSDDVKIIAFGVGKLIKQTAEEITENSIKVKWKLSARLDEYILRIYEGSKDDAVLWEKKESADLNEYTFKDLRLETDYFIEILAMRDLREVARIEVKARTKKSTVSNEVVAVEHIPFIVSGGKLHFLACGNKPVLIYDLSGRCVFNARVYDGFEFALPDGLYIVIIEGKRYKFVI